MNSEAPEGTSSKEASISTVWCPAPEETLSAALSPGGQACDHHPDKATQQMANLSRTPRTDGAAGTYNGKAISA